MLIIGTHHFVSIPAAIRYYRPYGFDKAGVLAKIQAGEIAIGPPSIQPHQTLLTIEGRFHTEEKE